ncbi:MAG: permease, partial [Archaeoglobales archaeon]
LIPTALAFTLFNFGIKYCRVEQAPLFALVEPVAAGFFGYALFGEVLTTKQIVGAVLILISVAIAARGMD